MVEIKPVDMVRMGNEPGSYPLRYRIPTSKIQNLSLQEKVWRAEKFALGTLLYELFAGHRIFEGMSDSEVQGQYTAAKFPDLGVDELSDPRLPHPQYHVTS